jgi:predicted glycoside hydrolase/deacetylase ChbG (UPF0249 family)
MKPRRLIVNADDYGRTQGVSAGIRKAQREGIVSSTSAMMNMPAAGHDLRLAQRECPWLGLGVHLVLTSGAPLLPIEKVSSLTGGKPVFPGEEEQIARLHTMDSGEVRAEWEAQIEKFILSAGRAPDHLDSHHHISYLNEHLFRVMLELAHQYACPIRLPRINQGNEALDGLPDIMVKEIQSFSTSLMDEFNPRHPDSFCSAFYDDNARREVLVEILCDLQPGSTELMCHPGYADEELLSGSSYSRQREVELALLTEPEIRALITQQGIQLIAYSQL